MYHYTDYGQKGAVIGALSGIDIALWDVAGKARREPVAKLLGGMFRTRRRPTPRVSSFERDWRGRPAGAGSRRPRSERLPSTQDQARVWYRRRSGGHERTAISFQEPRSDDRRQPCLQRGRRDPARAGAGGHGLAAARRAVVQEDLDGYAEVRRALATPVAGGRTSTRSSGSNLLAKRSVDIAQPDICIAGGFTGCRHIVALAHAHGAGGPHVWASAVGQAASLQLIASIPVANHSLAPKDILRIRYILAPVPRAPDRHAAQAEARLGRDPAEARLGIEVSRM